MLALRCTVATNCDRISAMISDTGGLVLRPQTWRLTTNGRSEAQLKTREGGPKHQTREPADRFEVLARVGGI